MNQTVERFGPAELRAAATALRAGRFAARRDTTVTSRRSQGAAPYRLSPTEDARGGWSPQGLSVRVLAAHSGAGASTVSLALADAAAAAGQRVRLLDAAAPAWSGLAETTDTEMGVRAAWRHGRRGAQIGVERLAVDLATPRQAPTPEPDDGPEGRLSVLDAGWSLRELLAHPSWIDTAAVSVDVVVTRANTTALGRLEVLLALLPRRRSLVLVVVGARRGSGLRLGAGGDLTHQVINNAVRVPHLARRPPDLGPGPLPKQLARAGHALLLRIQESVDAHGRTSNEEQP